MPLTRRRLLWAAPVAATAAACGLPARRPTVNVRDHGAAGDGVADDSAAITAAAAALRPGDTLYFPTGSYRFAQRWPPGQAAVVISGLTDVAVDFGRDAELLMDNLDGGRGTGHGILVRGPAAAVTLRNVRVRWRERPAQRSFGDGIRVVGFPGAGPVPADWTGSGGTVTGVRVLDCSVESSPQAGVIMMGVSQVGVDGLAVRGTLADGLHFNACRQVTVNNHRAVDAGDDGLALVTYYADRFSYNNTAHTFAFPELTDWSNAGFTVTDVTVVGGRANGVRIAGANGVSLRWLRVAGKHSGAGFIADSAAPGVDAGWFYVASRGIRVSRVRLRDCQIGVHLLARPTAAADRRFTEFDVAVDAATIRDCQHWAVRSESISAHPATGLRLGRCEITATSTEGGNGGVGLQNAGDIRVGELSVSHRDPVTVFSAIDGTGVTIDELRVAVGSGADPQRAEPPAVSFTGTTGRVGVLRVRRPDAPDTWQPVRVTGADRTCAQPDSPPVVLTAVSVDPAVTEPIAWC